MMTPWLISRVWDGSKRLLYFPRAGGLARPLEGETAREVQPEIAFVQGERAIVDSGMEEGELVVVIGQQSLSGGDAVTVAEVKE